MVRCGKQVGAELMGDSHVYRKLGYLGLPDIYTEIPDRRRPGRRCSSRVLGHVCHAAEDLSFQEVPEIFRVDGQSNESDSQAVLDIRLAVLFSSI